MGSRSVRSSAKQKVDSRRSTRSGTTGDRPRRGGRPRDPALDVAILEATRDLLVVRGYSEVTIADIAEEAGVTRPTIYRRWPGKFELVADALDFGLAAQRASYAEQDGAGLPATPFERFRQAVQWVDPCFYNPDAIVLQGNFMGETNRNPELLDLLTRRAVEPRLAVLEQVLHELKHQREVRDDIDVRTVATLCFGSFFGAHLRGERDHQAVARRVAAEMWAAIGSAPQRGTAHGDARTRGRSSR